MSPIKGTRRVLDITPNIGYYWVGAGPNFYLWSLIFFGPLGTDWLRLREFIAIPYHLGRPPGILDIFLNGFSKGPYILLFFKGF